MYKNIHWLIGGIPKKDDKISLSKKYFRNIKIYVFGKNFKKFSKDLKKNAELKSFKNLNLAVSAIFKNIHKKKHSNNTILFSPASASFDSFKNFEERGSYFNKLIKRYLMKEKLFSYISFYQWWKSIDKPILSLILLLFLVGLFFSLVSTSLIASDKLDTNTYFFFFKHNFFVFFGFFLIFFFSFIPEKEIYRISIIFFCLSLILLLLVPIVGVEIKGSKRWIDLMILPRIQPIEFVKPFLIVIISMIICSQKYTNFNLKYFLSFLLTILISVF